MSALLYLAPWFVLLAVWALARRATEDLIARIAGWRPTRHRVTARRTAERFKGFESVAPRGGLLLGLRLAVRGPPVSW